MTQQTQWGPFSVEGKTCIVTGGAMGIGFGIASRFVEGGANVLLVDIDKRALSAAVDKLAKGPGKVDTLAVDVGDERAGEQVVSFCAQRFGGLDVLVNNAGIYPQVPLLKMEPSLFEKVYRVNLKGLVFLSKAAALKMIEQGRGGRIINIGSIDSVHPSMVGLAAYDTSKGGVLMFTRAFALEVAPHGILVNAILPGGITTEGTQKPLEGSGMSPEQQKQMMAGFASQVPMKRLGAPDEIATVAVFFASEASRYCTGSSLVVDGGMLIG